MLSVKTRNGILALDLSSTVGFAMESLDGKPPFLGRHHFPRYRSQAAGPQGFAFMEWLCDLLTGAVPERVIYERPLPPLMQSSTATASVTQGFAYVTDIMCCKFHIPVASEHAGTVRKYFTGSGKSQGAKGRVIAECQRRGWDPPDDNAADAAALLSYAVHLYHPADAARGLAVQNLTEMAA